MTRAEQTSKLGEDFSATHGATNLHKHQKTCRKLAIQSRMSLLDVGLAVFHFRGVFELIESTYKFHSKRTVGRNNCVFRYETLCKSSLCSKHDIILLYLN